MIGAWSDFKVGARSGAGNGAGGRETAAGWNGGGGGGGVFSGGFGKT